MADKTSPARLKPPGAAQDQSAISDDISRIVSYLNTKRSDANERASDLVQELTHRREEVTEQSKRSPAHSFPTRPHSEASLPSIPGNPMLAERYHAFCRELDVLLDGFRARVASDKRIRH